MVDIEKVKQHLEAAKANLIAGFERRTGSVISNTVDELIAALALLTPEAVKAGDIVCCFGEDIRRKVRAVYENRAWVDDKPDGGGSWKGGQIVDIASCVHADSQRGGGVVDTLKRLREKIRQTKPDKAVCDFYYDGYAKARDNAVACVDALIDEEAGK